jgi:hypothetical protein
MSIRLVAIESDEVRRTSRIPAGAVVEHSVVLEIDGGRRSFRVFLRVRPLTGWDASLVHGDDLLETLLRCEPIALARLYAAVARFRREGSCPLPLELVVAADESSDTFEDGPSSRKWTAG